MIDKLRISFNRTRQAVITGELIEINNLLPLDNFKGSLSNSKDSHLPLDNSRDSLSNSKVSLNSNFKDSLPHSNSRDNPSNFKDNLNNFKDSPHNKVDSLNTNKERFYTRTKKTYQKKQSI